MKRVLKTVCAALLLCALLLQGCAKPKDSARVDYADWEAVLRAAKGTTVTFYGWGGSDLINAWIDQQLAPYCKTVYDVTVERVPMDIDMILNRLIGDKAADNAAGGIDLIWINGENFATAKDSGLLFGPFCQYVPNYERYVDAQSEEATLDFGMAIEGYEAPYSNAQLVFSYDSSSISAPPTSAQALLELCRQNPGKFTYEAPPGFTGSAFVRNILNETCDYAALAALPEGVDDATLRAAVQPGMEFLRQLNPYLWEGGATFPATNAQADAMFMDGQLLFSISYDPYHVSSMIANGQYPATAAAFVFDAGTVGNTNYVAIADNSQNIPGALCVADAILSVPMQAAKMDPSSWGALPVLSSDKLSQEEKDLFSAVPIGEGALPQDVLLARRIAELPAYLVPRIEAIWLEEVPGK
ncbi:MAG: ABC transporter substrate-binding protein [Christensenellaceae bacterium]|jgi:putative spermidine/putrescine transport system substrate-binding protein|nr:ABC transporter substrate-binding protein [Christensenellaceae bacterium]